MLKLVGYVTDRRLLDAFESAERIIINLINNNRGPFPFSCLSSLLKYVINEIRECHDQLERGVVSWEGNIVD